MSLENSLERIEQWLREHTPTTAALLAPPATDAEIAALEDVLGYGLRPEVKVLLRWHNGSTGFDGAFSLAPVHRMLDTRQIADRWQGINDGTRELRAQRPDSWLPVWLPLTTDEGLASLIVDHSPGGTGEVFYWDHVDRRHQQVPPWPSLADEVAELATALLTGGRLGAVPTHPGLRAVVAYDGELGWDE
jgi:cell wall assembly regulator SMI1